MSNIDLTIGNKIEKKEVVNMGKIKARLLNEKIIMEAVKEKIIIPKELEIRDSTGDVMDNGKSWAHLLVVDVEEEKSLMESGNADLVPTYKVKLANYQNESLGSYIGKKISTDNMELILGRDRYKNVQGIDFRIELKDIKVVG